MMRSPRVTRPDPVRVAAFVATAVATGALAACGSPEAEEGVPSEAPLLRATEPTLEIGVVEGDDAYTFAAVDDVLRLPEGQIAVSDGGNTRISIYDASGTIVRSWGTRGEGPGEFRTLSRIYPRGTDSLMAADNATTALSVFSLAGEYARQFPGVDLSRDSTFRLDSWLYGRFWIDGAVDAASRERVRAVLDRLPPPREGQGYRRVLVSVDGDLWIHEPTPNAGPGAPVSWTRLDSDGAPRDVVETPARFTLLEASGDELLGSWRGPADVDFVRVYTLTGTGETVPLPGWLQGPASGAAPAAAGPDAEEFNALMTSSIKRMASAQEIHYSTAFTYTTELDSLDFEPPEGIGVAFTHADRRGWAAVFTHPTADRLCGLAYGFRVPAGWVPGQVSCGERSSPPGEPGA
ncbi:MAG: hypothetical protein PVI31_03935 [Gemmatimonadota bacterium]